jgi:hypothetical protein
MPLASTYFSDREKEEHASPRRPFEHRGREKNMRVLLVI